METILIAASIRHMRIEPSRSNSKELERGIDQAHFSGLKISPTNSG
jgi:hypothetical protein